MTRALAFSALLVSFAASAQPKTDEEKTLYAIGYLVGSRNLGPLSLKPEEMKMVERGISDGAQGKKAATDVEAQMEKVNAFAQGRSSAASDKEKAAGREYAEKAAKEAGAKKIDVDLGGGRKSFLVYKTIKPGDGPSPAPSEKVKVNYEGRLTNGTIFDSSFKRGQPAEFPLNGVIKCWTEGVQRMKVNEKARLTCPSDVAYGDHGHPPTIPGGATLVFDVELLSASK
jgi:FKBP-type peptidyl-prolyl cis-trans isomerase FkpA